jgi:HK97 family phage portal protein
MSLISLGLSNPELFKGKSTVADVVDAKMAAGGYEDNAPTGVSNMPSMADVEAWENILIGLKTETGQVVTPERAKRCATVLAIMRGLSEDISALPCPLYKHGDKEDTVLYDHPVHKILNVAPNDIMTPMEVREHMMFDLMLWGQFFNLQNFDEDIRSDTYGRVISVWPLDAGYVTRVWREMVWTFTDPTTGLSGRFTPDMVWRGSVLSGNGIDGTAITLLAREAIGMLLAAEQQGARFFKQGVQTDLALELPLGEEAGEDTKKQLRQAFMQRHAGSANAFMPILLEGGMKATKIGLTAVESQYIEGRKFQIEEIARVFRYPEVLLGNSTSGKSSTYASAEQFFDSYTKHTLGPWATRLEQTGQRDLLTKKEQGRCYMQHDFGVLLKASETARIANWNAKIQGGWAQPQEARRAERMTFEEGLDYFSTPAGSTGTAAGGAMKPAPQLPDPKQTDQSALARRVAFHILSREQKALTGNKQDANSFYANFGSYIEGMTGADPFAVMAYNAERRSTEDRFSITATESAINALVQLCTKDK